MLWDTESLVSAVSCPSPESERDFTCGDMEGGAVETRKDGARSARQNYTSCMSGLILAYVRRFSKENPERSRKVKAAAQLSLHRKYSLAPPA